jgi:hypothetical protein
MHTGAHTMTAVPSPQGLPTSTMSWSPDAKRLAVDSRGRVAVLDLATGNVQSLVEGSKPAWSPSGEWIAYLESGGAKCFLVHPDGTGVKVIKKLRQALFSHRSFGWGWPRVVARQPALPDEMKEDGDYHDTVLLDVESGKDKANVGLDRT